MTEKNAGKKSDVQRIRKPVIHYGVNVVTRFRMHQVGIQYGVALSRNVNGFARHPYRREIKGIKPHSESEMHSLRIFSVQ